MDKEFLMSLEKLENVISKVDTLESNISIQFTKCFMQTYPYPNAIIYSQNVSNLDNIFNLSPIFEPNIK